MIFEPVYPYPICGGRIVLQGQFLKRQHEVAPKYGQIFARNVASSRHLIHGVVKGRCADKFCAVLHEEVDNTIDRCMGSVRPVISMVAQDAYAKAKQAAIAKVQDELPEVFLKADVYLDEAMGLEKLLTDRVRAMDVGQFEALLHPVFQEDEWILIVVGGILGWIVGSVQWYVLGS
jgi:uncharacterized membrane protein YheB (UPF0754 family)